MEQPFQCPLACVSCVMCDSHMMEVMSSGTSSEEENEEHNVGNVSLEVVEQDWSGLLINLFLEDCELARIAVSCHLAWDLLCQEMHDAWKLFNC